MRFRLFDGVRQRAPSDRILSTTAQPLLLPRLQLGEDKFTRSPRIIFDVATIIPFPESTFDHLINLSICPFMWLVIVPSFPLLLVRLLLEERPIPIEKTVS